MAKINTPLKDSDILSEVRYQSVQASGSEFASDELIESRKNALKYYKGDPRGDEEEGRSNVISKDVADMSDSMLTQMMATFDSDDLVQFEAVSEQDELQARTESKFCNYVVMEQNNGFILFETLLKDVLISKNATAKVLVDIKVDSEKEKYKGLNEMELMQVLMPRTPNEEIDVTKFDEKTGDVNLTRTITTRKLLVEAVAPENFAVTSEHKSVYLDDCTYCREVYWDTKSNLIEQGYDPKVVMNLPRSTSDTKIDSIERNTINDEQNFHNNDPSMHVVELEEHYIRIDRDGDGIAELLKVVSVENNLLYYDGGEPAIEEVPCIPYANGVAFLMGHRYYGQSVYDKLKDVQDIKTHFLRQWADNALISNHNKTDVIEDQVVMEDFLTSRPNAVRRVDSLDSARDVPHNDIGGSCQLALNYWDKVRTDRTGSSLDLQSNQMAMPSNVGDQGVNTLVANLEKVSALASKNFSETLVTSLYRIVHKYLKLYFPDDMNAKMGGEWQNTNPSQWNDRDQLNIIVPPTNSEKLVQKVAIGEAIQLAKADIMEGKAGITTDEGNIYQMKLDYMRFSGIQNPEKYLIDPNSPQAQQVAQQNAQMAQQEKQKMEEMQAQMTQKQDMLQMAMLQLQQAEIDRNSKNDNEEVEFDYVKLIKELDLEKYKIDKGAEGDEAKLVADNVGKIELESVKQVHKLEESAIEREADEMEADLRDNGVVDG